MTPNAKLTDSARGTVSVAPVSSPPSDIAALLAEADDHGLVHRLVHSLAAALRDSERFRDNLRAGVEHLSECLAASEAERERLQRGIEAALDEREATRILKRD